MIPLSDGIQARRFPYVNVAIVAANFAVWLIDELPHLSSSVFHASIYPRTVTGACHGPEPWGVSWFTAMFLDGSWITSWATCCSWRSSARTSRTLSATCAPGLLRRRRLRRLDDPGARDAAGGLAYGRARSDARGQRRDRRRPRRLLRPGSELARAAAPARLPRPPSGPGLPRDLVPLPVRRGQLRPAVGECQRRGRGVLRAHR